MKYLGSISDGKDLVNKEYVDDLKSIVENTSYLYPFGIEPFQVSFFEHSENLFSDFCYFISGGYYVGYLNPPGKIRIQETSNWKSWLIKVKPNTTYTVGPLDFRLECFDADLFGAEMIFSDTPPSATEPNTFTTGPNSYWMSLTQRIGRDMTNWMMVEGSNYPNEYISGYPQWVSMPELDNYSRTAITLAYNAGPIIVTYENDYYTVTIPNNTRIITPKGAIVANVDYVTITQSTSQFISYDPEEGWGIGHNSFGKYKYIIGYVNPHQKKSWFIGDYKEIDNTAFHPRIAFMGDSITAGVGTTKTYHEYLHDKYGFVCLNYGYGGAGYYRSYPSYGHGKMGLGVPGMGVAITEENYIIPNNVITRLEEVDSNINGIVIFAGTNDWSNAISMTDFVEYVDAAFEYCLNHFPNAPVLCMLPIHRKNDTIANSQGLTLKDYAEAILNECKKYSIAYVDTMTFSGLLPDNSENLSNYFTSDPNGIHPDSKGHKRIASVVGEMLKQQIDYINFV